MMEVSVKCMFSFLSLTFDKRDDFKSSLLSVSLYKLKPNIFRHMVDSRNEKLIKYGGESTEISE